MQVPSKKNCLLLQLMAWTHFPSCILYPDEQLRQDPLFGQQKSQAGLTFSQESVSWFSQYPCSHLRNLFFTEQSPQSVTMYPLSQQAQSPVGWQSLQRGMDLMHLPWKKISIWLQELASKTSGTLVPFASVINLVLLAVVFPEGVEAFCGVTVVGEPVMLLTSALTQRLLQRMKGQLQSVQLLPSALHQAQKMFLVEHGVQIPPEMKYPAAHLVQATFERQVRQPTKIFEQVWQVTLKLLLTKKKVSLQEVQNSALEQVVQLAGQSTQEPLNAQNWLLEQDWLFVAASRARIRASCTILEDMSDKIYNAGQNPVVCNAQYTSKLPLLFTITRETRLKQILVNSVGLNRERCVLMFLPKKTEFQQNIIKQTFRSDNTMVKTSVDLEADAWQFVHNRVARHAGQAMR